MDKIGKCRRCKNLAMPGKSRCQYHLDLHAKEMKRQKQNRILKNLCIKCGKNPPRSNEICCNKCAIKLAIGLLAKRKSRSKCCASCLKPNDTAKTRCSQCTSKRRDYSRRLKLEVFNAYGGAKCACPGCPEKTGIIDFLTIDHIDGGGSAHRKKVGHGGVSVYRWLKKHLYPVGYRVLCFNCNAARHINGGICPHESQNM